jgi:hypothetical protein
LDGDQFGARGISAIHRDAAFDLIGPDIIQGSFWWILSIDRASQPILRFFPQRCFVWIIPKININTGRIIISFFFPRIAFLQDVFDSPASPKNRVDLWIGSDFPHQSGRRITALCLDPNVPSVTHEGIGSMTDNFRKRQHFPVQRQRL